MLEANTIEKTIHTEDHSTKKPYIGFVMGVTMEVKGQRLHALIDGYIESQELSN